MSDPRTTRADGLSRRDFARLATLMAAGAGLPLSFEAAAAQGLSARRDLPLDGVYLNANENPLGPCAEAIEAVQKIAPKGGRYLYRETFGFIDALAKTEDLDPKFIIPFAGSSDPLHRAVLAFTSPTKCLVVADPGYEAAEKAANISGASTIRVPLRADFAHDTAAMAKADPQAGLIYVCNPNNPTGTVTPRADIDALIANKPDGCVVLLDEAYIHYASTSGPCVDLVRSGKDVVILRTFSKLYGMAGLRAGAAFGRPDLLESMRGFGAGALPATGVVGATASLGVKSLVETRRRLLTGIREETFEWLDKKGFRFTPSECNTFMIDVGRPGPSVFDGLLKEKVIIGRTWPSWPKHVRVSIGTRDEMTAFRAAFAKVMGV